MSSLSLPKPAIGVGAVIFDHTGQVLLIRRGKPPAFGYWSLPGGQLEPGETLVQCCRREVMEEVGIEIEVGPLVAVVERIIEDFHYVIIDFLAQPFLLDSPTPVPQSDVSDARWVSLEELGGYALVEGLERIIRRACQSQLSGFPTGLMDAVGDGRDFLPAESDSDEPRQSRTDHRRRSRRTKSR